MTQDITVKIDGGTLARAVTQYTLNRAARGPKLVGGRLSTGGAVGPGRIARRDMFSISIDGGDGFPWVRVEGGERRRVKGRPEFAPLVLSRARGTQTVAALVALSERVGEVVRVRVEHMTADGKPAGSGLEYTGVLEVVAPAAPDANYVSVAEDRVTIQPHNVKPIE